jgi:hypothetical protein
VFEGDTAIDRDRMMEGLEDGPTVSSKGGDTGGDALIVVNKVELFSATPKRAPDPHCEGPRFRKAPREHSEGFNPVRPVAKFPGGGKAKGIGLAIEIEPENGSEPHALVEERPGGTREYLHGVAEGD